jgi:phage shock protein A
MNELTLWRGKLYELKQKYKELDLEASALLHAIRILLDPHEEDLTRLRLNDIRKNTERFLALADELKRLREKTEKLEASING